MTLMKITISNIYIQKWSCIRDLIIRTGGDERISNFLPWQANGMSALHISAPILAGFEKLTSKGIRTFRGERHEKQKNTIMRIVKLLSYYGMVEVEDVIRIARGFISIPKRRSRKILQRTWPSGMLF